MATLSLPRVADGDPLPADWLAFLHRVLSDALNRLGAHGEADPVVGPCGGSIGVRIQDRGQSRWLRVAPFLDQEMDPEWWTGNYDANVLAGVARPRVHQRLQWVDEVPIGADIMDYVTDRPCAPFRELLEPFEADDAWYRSLRASLDSLAAHDGGQDLSPLTASYREHVAIVFGRDAVPGEVEITVQHADLHWSNVTAPTLWIFDWERWGPTIHGLGAASLYCFSLLIPDVAAKIYETFLDVLDSPTGRYAQLCVIADRIGHHDPSYDDDLDALLRRLGHRLLAD